MELKEASYILPADDGGGAHEGRASLASWRGLKHTLDLVEVDEENMLESESDSV